MKHLIALVLALTLLPLSACGAPGGPGDRELDLEALAASLLESGVFAEPLNRLDDGIFMTLTGRPPPWSMPAAALPADELALFEFSNEAEARSAMPSAQARIAAQRDSFAAYIPEEVPKLDRAVIDAYGRYLAVCVSGGDGAGKIISEYFEQEG